MVEIDLLFDSFQFNIILFVILFALAFLFSRFLDFKSFTSVIALHALLIFVFAIIGVIDYMYLIFAIIELIVIIKVNTNSNGAEIDSSD